MARGDIDNVTNPDDHAGMVALRTTRLSEWLCYVVDLGLDGDSGANLLKADAADIAEESRIVCS